VALPAQLIVDGADATYFDQKDGISMLLCAVVGADTGTNPRSGDTKYDGEVCVRAMNMEQRSRNNSREPQNGVASEPLIMLLLQAGADPTKPIDYMVHDLSGTALYCAASRGLESIVRLLAEAGADLDEFAGDCSNPLHIASQTGHTRCAANPLAIGPRGSL
jgi:hypothetical protein